MAAYKKIQGNPIKPQGGKPSGGWSYHGVVGQPKSVKNVKGGPDLGGRSGADYFAGKGASGRVSITGGQK